MTFDSDGRDLAHQAERLAADKRDDSQILAADIVVAGLIGLIVVSVVWSFITWVSQ